MNNKTIIEFGFRIIWRIMEISEGDIRRRRTASSKFLKLNSSQFGNSHAAQYLSTIPLSLKPFSFATTL